MQKKIRAAFNRRCLVFLAGICLLAIIMMVWALMRNTGEDNAVFVPPSFEKTAQPGEPKEISEDLGYSEFDAGVYRVALCGTPMVQNGNAVLYLTNPSENEVWLKIRIMDMEGQILGESGLLKPGEYVETVTLSIIPEEDTSVEMKIMAYELETYYSAGTVSLNTVLQAGQ